MPPPPDSMLSQPDLERLSDFIYRRTGMLFGENKRYYIDRRIADRMAAIGALNFADYFGILRGGAGELEFLINAFTVNETYFYREERHFQSLSSHILPAVAATRRPGDKIRIWSIPCSTGEEPYSIAIWLLENWAMVDAYNVEIVGSDIDTQALAAAAEGDYGERALSRLPPDLIGSYFESGRGGRRRIIGDLRESVTFTPANLVDGNSMVANGTFDVIFCRNVLIYFDDAARLTALTNLKASSNPGGFLFLGHTESMANIHAQFQPRRFGDVLVYQNMGAKP